MVTETQVREAEPILAQIDQLNALLGTINTASADGWVIVPPLYFHDVDGQTQTMDVTGLPTADILNALFQSANTLLTQLNAQLAAI